MSHPQRLRGHIYVVRFRGIPYTKVGLSAQPLKRVNQLRAAEGRGTEVESLWVSKGDWYETSHEGEIQRRLLTRYRRRVWPERPHQYTKEWSAAPWEDGVELAGELLPGEPPPLHAYPVYAYARAGAADVAPQFDGLPIDAFHTDIRIPERPPILPFALRVRGDSMVNPLEPDSPDNLPEGTDVLINPHIEPRMGDYVAAADLESEGGTIVKEYALAPIDPANPSGAKQLSLRSLNPKYAPERLDERFRILGVVVDSRKPSYRRGRRF